MKQVFICDDNMDVKDNPFFSMVLKDPDSGRFFEIEVFFLAPDNDCQLKLYKLDAEKWEACESIEEYIPDNHFPEDSFILLDTFWRDKDHSEIIPRLRDDILQMAKNTSNYTIIVYTSVSVADARRFREDLEKSGYKVSSNVACLPRSPQIRYIERLREVLKAISEV